ncbi:MAG: MerR family transcriptional regulator, partial [Labilithrix sp.]|nr:MerR family transcriptional regulator [Labilithrix sp.]
MGELPPKLFFRIGEVAGLVGVEPHVLRYWEREFRSIRPTKSAKGQRVYSRKDVENLLRVRDLLYRDGFTIAGAKKKLQRGDADQGVAFEGHAPDGRALDGHAFEGRASNGHALDGHAFEGHAPDGRALEGRAPAVDVFDGYALAPRASTAGAPARVAEARLTAGPAPEVREKLIALRSEVEAFLDELSGGGPAPRANAPTRTNGAG